MKQIIPINLATEDSLSEAVLRKMIMHTRRSFHIGLCYSRGGITYLKRMLPGFNSGAKATLFLVLIDFDRAECPPFKFWEWLHFPRHHNLLLRVAVKEVESWLLADRLNFAKFLGISKDNIPADVEGIEDPKEFLINLARRSRKRLLREDIIPSRGSTAKIGPNYNGCLISFVADMWDVHKATQHSPSIKRTMTVLRQFHPE